MVPAHNPTCHRTVVRGGGYQEGARASDAPGGREGGECTNGCIFKLPSSMVDQALGPQGPALTSHHLSIDVVRQLVREG
jgi:hypothetical protein